MATILSSSDSAPVSYVIICCIAEAPLKFVQRNSVYRESLNWFTYIYVCAFVAS
jgi:hypothetical protein